MNLSKRLIYTLLLIIGSILPISAQSTKNIHKQIHSQLLSNAKNSLDKSVIQDYIKRELEIKEQNPLFEGLSEESISMISDLLNEAKSHTGKRYRSGAKGPNNFDCSGFTGYVYNQFGYNIGSSSQGQFKEGIEIEDNNLRPGDLVFFNGRRVGKTVGHVGIVVTVDNENKTFTFIHAATSGGIQIDNSTAPYYSKRYLGARRIITE